LLLASAVIRAPAASLARRLLLRDANDIA
jgi:hypothetical protein